MKFRRLVMVVGVVLVASLMGGCNWLYRVSVDSSGGDANKPAGDGVATSADGRYVVFGTAADDIVADDTNPEQDLFKRDLTSGTTELVSIDPNGSHLSVPSLDPAMSDDGRYVAFLVYNYSSHVGNRIYVRDTIAHTTIDVTSTYAPALYESPPSISGDGRYVAWNTYNGFYNGFVMWDRQSGATTQLDIEQGGLMYTSPQLSFSSDGRYIAFTTQDDLLGDNPENHTFVYVKDMQSGTTERVSVASDGSLPNGLSELPSISDDGRYVSFQSSATNLVPGLAGGGAEDIFVRDRTTGTTVFASANATGQDEENGRQFKPSLTGDGHKVAFHTQSPDLVAGVDSSYSVVVRDLVHGTTQLASTNALGTAIDSMSWSLSRDGNIFAFVTHQRLMGSDHNRTFDVYVRTMDVPTIESVGPSTLTPGSTTPVTITGTGFTAQATVQALTESGGLDAVTVDDVSFVSSTELHATITVPADLADTTMSLIVTVPGPFPGGAGGNTADATVTLD